MNKKMATLLWWNMLILVTIATIGCILSMVYTIFNQICIPLIALMFAIMPALLYTLTINSFKTKLTNLKLETNADIGIKE